MPSCRCGPGSSTTSCCRRRDGRDRSCYWAGLDTRAYRLALPPETTVYEIDHRALLAAKESVLRATGARRACARTAVGVDLRSDWSAALRAAGFDPAVPTTWL